jgi:5-methyltetrahydropteroyltriglutamate--homocysteine methyltransferase
MTRIRATTPGLYPLPDWAKEELADLKGHQKEDLVDGEEGDETRAAYDRARAEVIDRQQAAGLDLVVEGQLRWDDMLAHPLAVHDNVETRGIVRYYDNNNFYREPVVTEELDFDGDVAADLDDVPGVDQAVLPGPYSLADLATDEHYGDDAALLAALGEFLAGEVAAVPEHATLFLHEPSYVTNPPGEGVDERASDAIDAVASATDADVVVNTAWAAFDEKPYAHLLDADVNAVGFDFVAGDREDNLYCINEYGTTDDVALGLVDGQNTLVEEPETVADRVAWIHDRVPAQTFETTYVHHNVGSFYLPVNRHREKLAALAEGAQLAERRLTEEVTA